MGRVFFSAILILVGLLYLWLAYMATFGSPIATVQNDPFTQILGLVMFLVIGGAAALAGFSVLRQKRR